jgi:hypothetical protein
MSVKSFGNPASSFRYRFGGTGKRASKPYNASVPFSATGGNVSALAPGNGYIYHTFTSSGTFTATGPKNIEILLIAGGGGAGAPLGSGGGAGGLVYHTSFPVTTGSYPVTVGGGGAGATGPGTPGTNTTGAKGNSSTFGGMTGDGGGGGSPFNGDGITGSPTVTGGSGGGYSPFTGTGSATQAGLNTPFVPNPNFAQYGFNGAPSGDPVGGAGGGAGAVGSAGAGGSGRQYPAFTGPVIGVSPLAPLSGYFAGGGAGGGRSGTVLSGGLGGGGPNPGSADRGTDGTTNSGGGAGGGAYISTRAGNTSAAGGSGIVIIRYLA